MGILKDFYDGNIHPIERVISQSAEYQLLSKDIGNGCEYFAERLSEEDRKRFREWNQKIREYEEIIEFENFSYGFRLGSKFSYETILGKDSG